MFHSEGLHFDITVPIYPLLIMLVFAGYWLYLSHVRQQVSLLLLAGFVAVWTFEIFIARDIWLFGWPITLFEQNLFKNASFDALLGPLLFLSIRLAAKNNNKLMLVDALFIIPVLAYGFNSVTILSLTNSEIISFYQGTTPASFNTVNVWLLNALKSFQWHTLLLLGCCIGSIPYLVGTHRWQSADFAMPFRLLMWCYLACYAAVQSLVGFGVLQLSWLIEGPEHLTWIMLIATFFLLFQQHKAPQQPEVNTDSSQPQESVDAPKYQSSSLDESTVKQLFQELQIAMSENKLYLNDSLSLGSLAKELDVTTHQLSQTINQMADRNFFDFINGFRINDAQKLLHSESKVHLSVSYIGEEVGFKSKSAFYAAFKKHAGCTPAEFRKTQLN
jgi:AraC-like DNA-binding protein